MYYTIASTREHGGLISIDFIKNGNRYVLELHNKGRNETTRKTFDDVQEALVVYLKFVESIITGCYSYEDRKNWLK